MAEFVFAFQLQPAVTGDAEAKLSDDPRMTDMVVYDSWRAEAGLLRGRRAIVERARATGGMAGHKRERQLSALIQLRPGDFVRFRGSTGDDCGYGEVLAIAATVDRARCLELTDSVPRGHTRRAEGVVLDTRVVTNP